ncbi:hypothetical protein ACIRRH_00505 [Kitasatospora sp. NPDC101235]|uniref:hypothetical protein n=1 Tax=Kitasatospora sp. NPDC101235 TaxID=3364101 RepID=UPI00380ECA36
MADENTTPPLSEQHRAAAEAHTDTAHEQHDLGRSAHQQITHANNANQTAARLEREGR